MAKGVPARHPGDPSRQLDLIKANVAGFTGMILFEHLTWVCIAVDCVAVAVLAAATSQITRFLLRPAGLPGEIVLPEHDHVAA